MDEQFFNQWHKVKKRLNKLNNSPSFHEREIWWCSVGQNIGFEIYGKNTAFVRPVLVLKKFSHYTFLGIPLTSNPKSNQFRYPYSLNGKNGTILLDQIRTYDARRFTGDKITRMHPSEFEKLKQALRTCFNL